MDSDSLKRVLHIKGVPVRTMNTITDTNLLNKELAVIRREGVSFDDEEFELGIRSVAAEVKGSDGSVIAALAVIGPGIRISVQKMRSLIPAIKTYADEISRATGISSKPMLPLYDQNTLNMRVSEYKNSGH